MRAIALRLRPGADLKAELLTLAAREGVQAGWVLTCVGSLVAGQAAARRRRRARQGAFEIVALTGTLSRDGGHLHLAVADHQGRTVGGHLTRAAPCAPPPRSSLPSTTGWCSPASTIRP